MSTYRMSDGMVVKTENASLTWDEKTRWNGSNHISVATGSQWDHETLYRSRKGRYYIEHISQWQGSEPHAEWISDEEAVRWMITNDCEDIPDELKPLVDDIID